MVERYPGVEGVEPVTWGGYLGGVETWEVGVTRRQVGQVKSCMWVWEVLVACSCMQRCRWYKVSV